MNSVVIAAGRYEISFTSSPFAGWSQLVLRDAVWRAAAAGDNPAFDAVAGKRDFFPVWSPTHVFVRNRVELNGAPQK